MAKYKMSEKTRAILDYLSRFPDVTPKDLAERISEETAFKGVTNEQVSKIKSAYRSQLKGQTEAGPQAMPTPTPVAEVAPEPTAQPASPTRVAAEITQPAPADNGTPRGQLGVTESVRLLHRLLADIGSRTTRDVVDLVAAMGPDEAHRLIDLLQEIDEDPEGAKGSKP